MACSKSIGNAMQLDKPYFLNHILTTLFPNSKMKLDKSKLILKF